MGASRSGRTRCVLVVLFLMLPLALTATSYSVDWSVNSTLPYPVSLLLDVNDTVMFTCTQDLTGTSSQVVSVVSRTNLALDPQAGSFDLSFVCSSSSSVVLTVSTVHIGRTYFITDRSNPSKYGQLIVRGSAANDFFVPLLSTTPVVLSVPLGARVIWDCPQCATTGPAAWVAPTDAAGNFLPLSSSSSQLPFEQSIRSRYWAQSFLTSLVFRYGVPTAFGVAGGSIFVGTVTPPSQQLLPIRNEDLTCACDYPPCHGIAAGLPCAENITSTVNTTLSSSSSAGSQVLFPSAPCSGITTALCAQVEGFLGRTVWGVSGDYGNDCNNTVGSVAMPFRSIGRALCSASGGDVVLIDVGVGQSSSVTLHENMVEWDKCVSCASMVLEDRVETGYLGQAKLRSGGTVYLRKSSPEWSGQEVNIVWYNVHLFSRVNNATSLLPNIQ